MNLMNLSDSSFIHNQHDLSACPVKFSSGCWYICIYKCFSNGCSGEV